MNKNEVNAGPRAQNGFALQRNSALFILLDNYYTKFKEKNYFISIEHHDDFIFCFLNKDEEVEITEAYQSKKKSSGSWTITKKVAEILVKLLQTGVDLNKDSIPKSNTYKHDLFFSSNASTELKATVNKKDFTTQVNEEDSLISYNSLCLEIKNKIENKIKSFLKSNIIPPELLQQLNNLHFTYLHFTTTDKEQQNQLIGKLEEVFTENITDYRAALNTLLTLFRQQETIYNQGAVVKLLDTSKRVTSSQINETLEIVTTRSKAFKYWRNQTEKVSSQLGIRPFERDSFELTFKTSFDLFKSILEPEHQKVLSFVKSNYINCTTYTEVENVNELYNQYKKIETTNFSDFQLKSIIYAAYFESI